MKKLVLLVALFIVVWYSVYAEIPVEIHNLRPELALIQVGYKEPPPKIFKTSAEAALFRRENIINYMYLSFAYAQVYNTSGKNVVNLRMRFEDISVCKDITLYNASVAGIPGVGSYDVFIEEDSIVILPRSGYFRHSSTKKIYDGEMINVNYKAIVNNPTLIRVGVPLELKISYFAIEFESGELLEYTEAQLAELNAIAYSWNK